jgi:hypothetical protein
LRRSEVLLTSEHGVRIDLRIATTAVGGGNLIGMARGGINSSNTGKLYWGADPSFVASIVQGWRRGSGTEGNILVPRRGASRRKHREEVMKTWDTQGIAMRKFLYVGISSVGKLYLAPVHHYVSFDEHCSTNLKTRLG